MKIQNAFNVQVWCGLREGYDGPIHSIEEVYTICQEYVNEKKECVTVTPTTFIYTNGSEPGVIVGLIAYPRFPKPQHQIEGRAVELAKILMVKLKQFRATVTTPNSSILLEEEDLK